MTFEWNGDLDPDEADSEFARVCVNCGKNYGAHFGEKCKLEEKE